MKGILFTHRFAKELKDDRILALEQLGYKVYYENETTFEYKEYMKDIEVLSCYTPFKRLDIDKFHALKWIQLTSMGFEQVPKEKVLERNIVVTNNKGGYSIPMGEWVVLNILELIKNRKKAYVNQSNNRWYTDFTIKELYNKTVSFIGTGDIAVQAAKRLSGFGVKILGVNTNGRYIGEFDQCFKLEELDYVLAQSDVVVICLPHTNKTRHLIDKSKLKCMKPEACLINVSRGAIIKEEDLIRHLEAGNLWGVALDVFEEEPLPEDSKLWDIDRVVVTSHNSWVSEVIEERRWELIYRNLKRYANGEQLLNRVEINKGY